MAENNKYINDIKIKVNKVNNDEILIDGEFATIINISLNSEGELATSFFGLYSKDILNGMEKEVKKYFKELKKNLKKNPPQEESEITLKDEDLPEDKKLKDEENKDTSVRPKPISNGKSKENKDIHKNKENVNKSKVKNSK